jgi:cobalt-zinc-cadmium efflux system outer membrane protein
MARRFLQARLGRKLFFVLSVSNPAVNRQRSGLHYLPRMIPKFPLAALCFALAAVSSPARPATTVSFDSVAGLVRSGNPDLAAARLQIAEATARAKQAGLPANPEIESEFRQAPSFREGGLEIAFTQRFPVTARLRLEKAVALADIKAAEAEIAERERELIADARAIVVKCLAARERKSLLAEQSKLAGEFAAFLAASAAKGEGSPLDVGQAKLEANALALEIRRLEAEQTALLGELRPLLGLPPGDAILFGAALPPAVMASVFPADPAARPDYRLALVQVETAERGVELENARRREDWQGGLLASVERMEDAPEGYQTDAMIGFRLSIPLPLWNGNEGAIEEAEIRVRRARMEVDALARRIVLEADAAFAEMKQWAELIREIDASLLPLAREQAALAEKAYREGQGELQALLRARSQAVELATSRVDAQRDFHLARARLLAATGKN